MTIYKELIELLLSRNLHISTAESLTGGMLISNLVSVPGASGAVLGGFVTYCDEIKHKLLGVSCETLEKHGAISSETAYEMCLGAAERSGSEIALSTTGNAGPDCAEGKEAGLVYIGVNCLGAIQTYECHFKGDRQSVREQAAQFAVRKCLEKLDQ